MNQFVIDGVLLALGLGIGLTLSAIRARHSLNNSGQTDERRRAVDVADHERERAQEALRAGEVQFRSTLDSIAEGCQLIGFDWRYLYLNDAAARHNRRPNSELLGRTMQDMWPGIEHTEVFALIRRCMTDRLSVSAELEYQFADGSRNWYDVRCQPAPEGVFVLSIDIQSRKSDDVERRLAEMTLRESEERFRELAENISEVFWITDARKERIIYVSPAFASIWGQPVEQLYDSPGAWLESVHPDDRDSVMIGARSRQATGEYDETYRIVRPDGAVRWIHDRAFPVVNAAGEVHRIVGIAEDVTERKEIEAKVLRTQRMESLGTLAEGIAHDLNNVLTPVLLSIGTLREGEGDPVRLQILDSIETGAREGAELVRDVLAFARGVEGRRIEVPIEPLIRSAAKIAGDSFLRRVNVVFRVAADLPLVVGDPAQLQQVLLNLFLNARDAMPEGGTITVSAEVMTLDAHYVALNPEAHEGAHVVISVRDTGVGMSQAVIDRAIEPFFTTGRAGKRSGLGLSTSMAIVKSHGGYLRIESSPNRGATVRIYLPANIVPATDATRSEDAARLPRGSGELILVVDDEPSVREVTKRTLEKFGYQVVVASNGADAVGLYVMRKDEIAAVITDMMMPTMDGPTMVHALRRLNPSVRVIAVSGHGDAELIAKSTSAGVRHFLPKPYTAFSLLALLRELLTSPAPIP